MGCGSCFRLADSANGSPASARDRIRTCDLRLRRPTLYPAELRARGTVVGKVSVAQVRVNETPGDRATGVRPRGPVMESLGPSASLGGGAEATSPNRPVIRRVGARAMVGATGFEPATSCSRSRRSTGLSYAPPNWQMIASYDAPGRTRTSNLLIRSQMLYPIELRAPTVTLRPPKRRTSARRRFGTGIVVQSSKVDAAEN